MNSKTNNNSKIKFPGSITFSKEINERHEGNRLFLGNHKYRTFMRLSGDSIANYYQLKSDPDFASELEKEDPKLFYSLIHCRIIHGDVNPKKAALFKNAELHQLCGYRESAGSSFAPLRILWEVTRKCNLKCAYCHSPASEVKAKADNRYELSLEDLFVICGRLAEANVFEVTLSGGECLLRGEELFCLIRKLRSQNIATNVISNGLLINAENANLFKNYDVSVAVSLDNYTESKQAITRGVGTFSAAVNAIQILLEHDVKVNIDCTLTRYNFDDMEQFVSFARNLGIKTIILQNLIPGNDIEIYHRLKLTTKQENRLPSFLPYLLRKNRDMYIQTTEVDFFSRLKYETNSFDEGEFFPNPDNALMSNSCSACHTAGFIDFLGNLYPCTSMRMLPMGNLVDSDLISLWMFSKNGDFVRKLRNQTTFDIPDCLGCEYIRNCSGGCRGEAFTLTGNWYALHDRCPIYLAKSRGAQE